jgi:hypothetical protein
VSAKAQGVAARILSDLRGLKGFGHLIDDIDGDIQTEIINDIAERIAQAYEGDNS